MTDDRTTARAVGFVATGGPEVLEVVRVPMRVPEADEVRIRVHSAGVHPADLALRAGARPIAGDTPLIPGMAVSGVVDAAGPDATWRVGDRVMAMALPSSGYGGGYRSHLVAPSDTVAGVPDELALPCAATLPMNGLTAVQVLEVVGLSAGQTLLVTGAGGALGALLLPLAARQCLRTIAVARAGDADRVAALGADSFVAAGPDLAERVCDAVGGRVDACADLAVLDDAVLAAVADGGVTTTLRGWLGEGQDRVRVAPIAVPRSWRSAHRLRALAGPGFPHRPVRSFDLERAADAHRLVARGGLRENVVLSFAGAAGSQ